MRCQVTRCGNQAENTLDLAIGYKYGDAARHPSVTDSQIVSICALHFKLMNEGKLKPKE